MAGLAPAALTSATLADALARLTERAGQELGIAAKFGLTGEPRALGTGAEVVLAAGLPGGAVERAQAR